MDTAREPLGTRHLSVQPRSPAAAEWGRVTAAQWSPVKLRTNQTRRNDRSSSAGER